MDIKLKIKKIDLCVCGHRFADHGSNGCFHVDKDDKFCLCAYDEFESKLKAYSEQLDLLLEIVNKE
jgi:hypothetical protein